MGQSAWSSGDEKRKDKHPIANPDCKSCHGHGYIAKPVGYQYECGCILVRRTMQEAAQGQLILGEQELTEDLLSWLGKHAEPEAL